MSRFSPTPEQVAWLRAGYREWRKPELTERFNARWSSAATVDQIRNAIKRHRILSGRPSGVAVGEVWRSWSPDMIAWLREHRASGQVAEVTARFNCHFHTTFTPHCLANTCKRYGITTGRDGRYAPGSRPWNAGMAGYQAGGRSRDTRFASGNNPWTTMPVGAYRQMPDGYWMVKVNDTAPAGFSRRDWRELHRLTWAAAHGPIPSKHVVVFLDGNPDNCLDAGNLACISRSVLIRLNQLGWDALLPDADLRRATVAAAKLFVAAHTIGQEAGFSSSHRQALIGSLGTFTTAQRSL